MVTDSGAVKGMTLDFCDDARPRSAAADRPRWRKAVQAELPDFVGATNPLDLTAQAITHLEMYEQTMTPLFADDTYGSLVLTAIVSSASDYALIKGRASLKPLLGAKKPVIYAMLGDEAEVPAKLIAEARAGNVPFFRSPERAFRALARITAYGRALAKRDSAQAAARGRAAALAGPGTLTEPRARPISPACGSRCRRAGSRHRLPKRATAAATFGFPLAAKLQSPAAGA